jgi:uncharacterized membrane protein YphA (DoxX/SURF4 family)
MATDTQPPRTSKAMFWSGWVVTVLPVLMLLMSGGMKLARTDDVLKEMARLGYPESTIVGIGITEITCAILYAIPQTSVLGAILLTGYLGGATATHVRVGDPFVPPIVFGAVVWLGLFLRDARVRALIPWRR